MVNSWLRLWHELPNDPKWRTIAKISNQPIPSVLSVYIHMLVCASNANERGRTQGWNDEDIASALDIKTDDVRSIITAMQGRVIEGDMLLGWKKRQPIKEDNSAERSKAWREKNRNDKANQEIDRTQTNADERKRTQDKDKDKDKDKEYNNYKEKDAVAIDDVVKKSSIIPSWVPKEEWDDFLDMRKKNRKPATERAKDLLLKDLEKLRDSGHDPTLVIQQSIKNNWQGLFEIRSAQNEKARPSDTKSKSQRARDAAFRAVRGYDPSDGESLW